MFNFVVTETQINALLISSLLVLITQVIILITIAVVIIIMVRNGLISDNPYDREEVKIAALMITALSITMNFLLVAYEIEKGHAVVGITGLVITLTAVIGGAIIIKLLLIINSFYNFIINVALRLGSVE